jgi:hypothetical protein
MQNTKRLDLGAPGADYCTKRTINLPAGHTLPLITPGTPSSANDLNRAWTLRVTKGIAEICGSELADRRNYLIGGCGIQLGVSSLVGAQLELEIPKPIAPKNPSSGGTSSSSAKSKDDGSQVYINALEGFSSIADPSTIALANLNARLEPLRLDARRNQGVPPRVCVHQVSILPIYILDFY